MLVGDSVTRHRRAHRFSTISVLGGLIAKGGIYARLWARQSGGFLGFEEAEAAE